LFLGVGKLLKWLGDVWLYPIGADLNPHLWVQSWELNNRFNDLFIT
jgi:hypothetical protein